MWSCDVPMPYGSSWDLLDVIRSMPSLRSLPFVITTRNKRKLEQVWAARPSLRSLASPKTYGGCSKPVEAAGTSAPAK